MSDHNGGPAFPVMPPCDMEGASASGFPQPYAGMSLRDYFAAKAMQAALSGASIPGLVDGEASARNVVDYMAKAVYIIADAMIQERAK